jgi:hypothetical protein
MKSDNIREARIMSPLAQESEISRFANRPKRGGGLNGSVW